MLNPVHATLSLPQTFGMAAACSMLAGTAVWLRLAEEHSRLFLPLAHRRKVDKGQKHSVLPVGASWHDHYGKRHHDVDVEHI